MNESSKEKQTNWNKSMAKLKGPLPLITVAIPVYNSEKHLEECLKSIAEQTYPNLDILVVNDGSTDLSTEICETYKAKDSRIRVFHKKNGGVGASRNTLLSLLKGDYVTFVDNDDWLEKEHIENLYEQLIMHEAEIAAANFYTYTEDKGVFTFYGDYSNYFEKEYTVEEWFEEQYNSKNNMSQCFTVPWGKLYKRELLSGIAFPEDKAVEDDYTTYMIYLNAKKITYSHRQTYIHRKSGDSITQTVDLTHVFPLQSIEERLTLLAALGRDISREVSAYQWRLTLHKKEHLKKGRMVEYRRVCEKLKLINNVK